MAFQDPESAFDNIMQGVTAGLQSAFPIHGRTRSLVLENVKADRAALDPHDIPSQYKARIEKGSWTVPVRGDVVLRERMADGTLGKELSRKDVLLMDVPRMTSRLSFIHKGQEYQVSNQWQLKPGVYGRRRQNGELEARFNVTGRAAFDMTFDPETKAFEIDYKKAKLPAYPILKALGASDADLEKAWGADILKANQAVKRNATTLAQFHRTSTNGATPSSQTEIVDNLRKVMEASKLRPEVTSHTLGAPFEHVTHETLTLAGKKLIGINNGAPEDDRDAIIFKTLRSTGELLQDQLKAKAQSVAAKIQRQLNKGEVVSVAKALSPGTFNTAVTSLFRSSLANPAKQVNPLDMMSSAMSTTIMGPGGIKSDMQVTDEAKMIHPSHFAFVDPLATPEGSSTGVVLRLPLGVKKMGEQPHIPLYNIKTGKQEWVDPITAYTKKVVLADQVEFKDGKPHALHSEVAMMGADNKMAKGKLHEADYVLPHSSMLFNLSSAIVPFVDSDSGNRVSMAVRHMEQSISLQERDKPLVQVVDPSGSTFEQTFGKQVAHTAPAAGKVVEVSDNHILLKDGKGETHKIHLYNHYPLNDTKSVLHSTPLVKVGDKVEPGQVIADNNYTKEGTLALGKNLRVAYMPYHGMNFEDSLVITESAAKKLASVHLHKHEVPIAEQTVIDAKKYLQQHPGTFSNKQLTHIGEDGVIEVGTKVRPGDPMVLAMQPYSVKDRVGLGALRKSLTNQFTDKALRWDSDHEGEVVAVHRGPEGIQVHVKTVEPMQVADKMCFDEHTEVLTQRGWRPVSEVTLADAVCCLVGAGDSAQARFLPPTSIHHYPAVDGGHAAVRALGQRVDLLVTVDHFMWCKVGGEYALRKAADLVGESREVLYASKDDDGRMADLPGAVTHGLTTIPGPVFCITVPGHVLYVRRNGETCWSGNSNRHGGKGVVGYIIPDHEAPKDKDGKPVDVLFNPCYDAETEFLTERGWVKGPDLQDREVFGTLNPKTYELEYQGGETQRTPYRGPMYRLESQHLDLMVTPNHSNFVATRSPGALGTLDLSTLSPGTFRREEARDHFGKARRFLKVGRWKGEEPGWVTIPAAERGASGPASEELMFLVEDYAEFLGWFVAEGSTYRTPAGAYCVDVAQRLSANPVKYRMIEGLIRRMGLNPNPGKDGFRIFNKSLFQHLRPLGKAHEKYVPEHIQKLSPRLLKIFLDAYLLGDGNTRNEPERGHHGSRRFCTVSKKLLDGLQLVAFKQGLVVNAHPAKERGVETQRPRYDAAVGAYSKAPWSNWSKETKENQIEAWIPYEGTVYCTQVPNGTLVVRRNGKIVVSGNCGVGGRMNIGQILETMAGKVAQKTGETYRVTNFDPHNKDRIEHMQSLLKKHGISDTEELFDPKTGQSYGHVLTGPQHFIKLVHQADKKLSVRSGMGLPKLPSDEKYDSMTFQPAGGGGTGGQSYGQLGMYALLAHGATNLLREAMTVKSQGEDPETNEAKRWKTGHADAWIAMQKGLPLPPPRPTFAFHRFTELLKAAGVNMEKKGSELMLSPMTDKQILSMSKGEIVNPTAAVHAKIDPQTNHYKIIKGGLFDDRLTGGHGGTHWSHVKLAEPMPNPLFEDPIKKLTGLTKNSFEAILYGQKQVLPATGAIVDKGGVTGGEGIKALLKNIDVKKELKDTLAKLKKAPASAVDDLYRKASYLQGLDKLGLRPEEAYVLHHIPVLPPKLRPLSIMEDGALRYEDLNGFYMNIGQLNSALTRLQDVPDKVKTDTRKGMYDGIAALFGAHALPEGAKVKGILHQIAGSSPKEGLFQKGILSPRQDATMRGVIIPGPDLHLDQVGLPKHAALVQYRPFVIKHMVQSGLAKTELDAQLMLSEVHQGKRQEMGVWRALERAVAERPILLKRDPALHKESILAFKPVLIEGNSIKLHPLVSGGFNADHDGDSCLGEVTYLHSTPDKTEVHTTDLADFPRLEDTKQTSGTVDVYQVPAGLYVMGNWLGRTQPCLVTEYSVHRELEMVVVGLSNRQKIRCSQDHSLATLNPQTLLIERTCPKDAEGRAVPLISLSTGHLTETLSCGGVAYHATAALGAQLGKLWVSPARDLGPGWSEALPGLLQTSLSLPLTFRQALVKEILTERLDRLSGEVHASGGEERQDLAWLLASCGIASRMQNHKLRLDLLTVLRASWLSIPGKDLCSWSDRFKVYTPLWVREELKIPSKGDWLPRKYVNRYLAGITEMSGYLKAWRSLCYEGAGFWTRVNSVKNTGEKVTMYDLTVEGALNFALSNGVVVWDTMSGYVPADEASIREAQRMFPSKNIFNEATTAPSHVPTMEARLGLHRLGKVGEVTSHKFDTHNQAIDALARQKVKLSDQIQVGGKMTTPGRILLSTAVPEPFKAKVLHNFEAQMDTGGLKALFAEVGKKTPEEYTKFADAMKDLGNATSTGMIKSSLTSHPVIAVGAHSYRLQDFSTDKAVRDPILQKAHEKVQAIQGLKITDVEKERRTVDTYLGAFQEINKAHLAKEKTAPIKNNLLTMTEAGVKPSKDQYAQMRIAPGIMKDSKGTLIPTPIQRSYGEGLTLSEYWTGTYGARSGSVKKVQEVQEPGYMTKLLQNTSMGLLIDAHDCGTAQGRLMPVTHADVTDRHLASELKVGSLHLPAGTLLSKDVVDQVRSLDPQAQLHVRSPLHCHSEKGVCQKCFGLAANGHHHPQGTNIGVLSAHALGERAVQLTLKAFHCMSEHTLVLCRQGERIFHTTLGQLFQQSRDPKHEEGEEWRTPAVPTEVWDVEGWTRIARAGRHLQQQGTKMVLARAPDGAAILSQDNHPHMLLTPLSEVRMMAPADLTPEVALQFVQHPGPEVTTETPPLRSGWLAGVYCAEGYLHTRKEKGEPYLMGIGISQKDSSPIYPKILESLRQEYGPGNYGAHGRGFQLYGRERALTFEKAFGQYSRNIGLASGWSGYPAEWLADFVAGVLDGDGSVYQPKDGGSRWVARIESTSWLLVQQLRHILDRAGVRVRLNVTPWRKLSRNPGFALSFTITDRVRQLLSSSVKVSQCRPISEAGRGKAPYISVKEVHYEEAPWVYDIETESHTFFANGLLTHNSGGSVSSRSGGALGAFQRLEQLTYLPDKIPNAATMVRTDGEITKITPTSTGTEIHIGDQVHFVGKDREGRDLHIHLPEEDKAPGYKPWSPPKVGMKVERGQTLTDPNRTLINPHRLYEATGDMTKVQHFLSDELHNIYSDEGVRKRAVEVVVRAMGNVTKIQDPHDHEGLLRGQFYAKTAVDKINHDRTQAGKPPIQHSPALVGVDLLPLAATQDWLAVLNHQKLRSTLKRNAALGAVSNIHGTHPIPGLAFGVEFGKPPAGNKTPY